MKVSKNLIRFDFICAFAGAFIYFVFFDFLLDQLAIPYLLACTQLAANFLYGVFGVFIYLKARELFKFLVYANFAYALFCIGTSIALFTEGKIGGAALLVLEGHFILILAKVEHSLLKRSADLPQLGVRDIVESDIPLIQNYWAGLTQSDLDRMGIDPKKLDTGEEFVKRITGLLTIPPRERAADPLIWEVDGRPVGFTTMNNFQRPTQADIHLHMFDKSLRGRGLGRRLFAMSVKRYFERHDLEKIICQPAARNPGPNKVMVALGIPIQKTYTTIPSMICFEHEVNCYEIGKQFRI